MKDIEENTFQLFTLVRIHDFLNLGGKAMAKMLPAFVQEKRHSKVIEVSFCLATLVKRK